MGGGRRRDHRLNSSIPNPGFVDVFQSLTRAAAYHYKIRHRECDFLSVSSRAWHDASHLTYLAPVKLSMGRAR